MQEISLCPAENLNITTDESYLRASPVSGKKMCVSVSVSLFTTCGCFSAKGAILICEEAHGECEQDACSAVQCFYSETEGGRA